ncbi:MAG TPA: hypothetical protein VI643_01530 [Planctomycetota bacterium]|nr:hypothetical protein [Planctomycetota bacterium]
MIRAALLLVLALFSQDPPKRPGAQESDIEHEKRKVVGCVVRVAVQPDATREWFDAARERFEKFADALWSATRGQMAIVEARLTDQAGEDGDLVIENLDRDSCDSRKGVFAYWDAKKRIRLGGRFQILTMLHEWGHVKFDLPEEYGKNACECLMSTGRTMREAYCDRSNHKAAGDSCWERIVKLFPAWARPPAEPGKRPELKVSIEDR